jgi:hypothetical protein
MGLRPINDDENRVRERYSVLSRGAGEIRTALDMLRP